MLQPKVSSKFLHGAKRLLIHKAAPRLLICEEFCGIARCHLHNIVLRAALRREERDLAPPFARSKPRLNSRTCRIIDVLRQEDLTRYKGRLIVVLFQKGTQDVRIGLLLAAAQEKVFSADHLAAADEEDLHTDARRRARHADRILIACPRYDVLPLCRRTHGTELIAEARRCLKVICLRCRVHPLLQLTLYIIRPSFKKEQGGADHRTVVLLPHLADAGGEASLDVVLKARTLGHRAARTQRKKTPQELQAVPQRRHIRIGAEVARAVTQHTPRDKDARKSLLHRHLDIGVTLIVLQPYIITRPMFLDQVRLKDQRLHLVRRHDRLKVSDMRDHCAHLWRVVSAALKILPNTVFEDNCLAHIDDFSVIVLHNVDSRTVRQQLQFLCNNIGHISALPSCG